MNISGKQFNFHTKIYKISENNEECVCPNK